MFSNQSYTQQGSDGWKGWSFIQWLLIVTGGFYLIENLSIVWFNSSIFLTSLGIFPPSLKEGFFWTPLTYALLHDPIGQGGIWHIVMNGLVIFFAGKATEEVLGFKRTAYLYIFSVLLGGLLWSAFHLNSTGLLLGASAGALGLLTFFCLENANNPMTFLIFFVIPVTMKPKWMLIAITALETLGFLFTELPGPYNIAHSAHLGGMAAGGLFYLWHKNAGKVIRFPSAARTSRGTTKIFAQKTQVSLNRHEDIKAEVDVILDKINKQGFNSLSEAEKATLQKAHDLLR